MIDIREGSAPIQLKEEGGLQIVILLLPGFSNLVLGSTTAPIMAVNSILGEDRYFLRYASFLPQSEITATAKQTQVQAEAGNWMITEDVRCIEQAHCLLVCGGSPVSYEGNTELSHWLAQNANRFGHIAGLATGSLIVAEAGLFNQRKAALHWWDNGYIESRFPAVRLSNESFVVEGDRASCLGGTAAMDMMTLWLAQQHGPEIAESLAQHFIRARIRSSSQSQRKRLNQQQLSEQPKLAMAIALMEANVEEPLSTDDLAQHVDISRRQLERLFKKYLDSVPSRYYQFTRLEKARSLLHQTDLSVLEIAMQCGYSSGAHLSTNYRNHYGMTPSEERKRRSSPM